MLNTKNTADIENYGDIFYSDMASVVSVLDTADMSEQDIELLEAMYQTAFYGGFLAVSGESGSGKTTLRRDLIDRINRENTPVIVIGPYVLAMEDNDVKGKTLKASNIAEAIVNTLAPLENLKRSPEARSV